MTRTALVIRHSCDIRHQEFDILSGGSSMSGQFPKVTLSAGSGQDLRVVEILRIRQLLPA
jgi:hypothetical protein